jgi:hypothetical protein
MDLYRKPDIISEITEGSLRWLGHAEIMPEERSVKFFNSILPPQEKNLLKSQEIDG